MILELLKNKEINLDLDYSKVGKWWHKDKEIDTIALNKNTKEILFAECKWKDKVNPEEICEDFDTK